MGGSGGFTLHWDGTSWTQVTSPSPSSTTDLDAVSAVSSSDVWAVGLYTTGPDRDFRSVILHWDGTSWTQVTSPEPGMQNFLTGVTADSPTDAWAVGEYNPTPTSIKTLILHWDGTSWTKVSSPSPGVAPGLNGVAAVSSSDIFAVGGYGGTTAPSKNLALESDGTTWTKVPTPNPSSESFLAGVSAVSSSQAWAAGSYDTAGQVGHSLVLAWNGTSWTKMATPDPGQSNGTRLTAVGASSGSDAWAVGFYETSTNAIKVLILHWNGTNWTRS